MEEIENLQHQQTVSNSPNASSVGGNLKQIGSPSKSNPAGEVMDEDEIKWDAHNNENRKQIMLIVEDNHFMQQTI